ncbi:MAG: PEP-CTERM sorting domain-containing protein [Armatimonadota bacterium]|nr:PEP-CTERM sorting domain-containing protein [bacterium]
MCFKMSYLKLAGMICLLMLGLAVSATATTWDAYADWSNTSNPNGQYMCGTRTTVDGTSFTTFDTNSLLWGVYQAWTVGGAWDVGGLVAKNATAGNLIQQPGVGAYSVLRWKSNVDALVNIDVTWSNTSWTSADAHLVHNGTSIYDCAVNWAGPVSQHRAESINVHVGDTIEAVVGSGTNGYPGDDGTNLWFTVSTAPVPEPSSILAMLSGLVGLGGVVLRRKIK